MFLSIGRSSSICGKREREHEDFFSLNNEEREAEKGVVGSFWKGLYGLPGHKKTIFITGSDVRESGGWRRAAKNRIILSSFPTQHNR